jgi:hypothetical protein
MGTFLRRLDQTGCARIAECSAIETRNKKGGAVKLMLAIPMTRLIHYMFMHLFPHPLVSARAVPTNVIESKNLKTHQRVQVRVAQRVRDDLDPNLACLWRRHCYILYL